MLNPAPSSTIKVQSAADTPAAREVIFELGAILAVHLVLALAVTVVLQAFGEF